MCAASGEACKRRQEGAGTAAAAAAGPGAALQCVGRRQPTVPPASLRKKRFEPFSFERTKQTSPCCPPPSPFCPSAAGGLTSGSGTPSSSCCLRQPWGSATLGRPCRPCAPSPCAGPPRPSCGMASAGEAGGKLGRMGVGVHLKGFLGLGTLQLLHASLLPNA